MSEDSFYWLLCAGSNGPYWVTSGKYTKKSAARFFVQSRIVRPLRGEKERDLCAALLDGGFLWKLHDKNAKNP